MGLNESYIILRGQILVMNPPSITQVFALVIQEETQREVGNLTVNTSPQLACAVQASARSTPRKDRPLCANFGLLGHTKDKCFKLHGYPPRHKKFKASASHVIENSPTSTPSTEQYQQMLTYIQAQIANTTVTNCDTLGKLCIGISLSSCHFTSIC